jgi:hypothetical protein
MTRDAAMRIHALLLTASGAIDQSVVIAQTDVDADELREYKLAAGKVLAALFDELLMGIYRQHPDLIPPELDRRTLPL